MFPILKNYRQHNLIRPSKYRVQSDTLDKSRHHLQTLEHTGQHTQGRKHIVPSPRPWKEEHDSFPLVAGQPCLHNTLPWHPANANGPEVRSRTRHVGQIKHNAFAESQDTTITVFEEQAGGVCDFNSTQTITMAARPTLNTTDATGSGTTAASSSAAYSPAAHVQSSGTIQAHTRA